MVLYERSGNEMGDDIENFYPIELQKICIQLISEQTSFEKITQSLITN